MEKVEGEYINIRGKSEERVVLIQIWGVKFENIQPELLWKKEVIIGNETGNETALSNPASVYCLEQGGKLEIRREKEGNEFGVCIFSNGSECEE